MEFYLLLRAPLKSVLMENLKVFVILDLTSMTLKQCVATKLAFLLVRENACNTDSDIQNYYAQKICQTLTINLPLNLVL